MIENNLLKHDLLWEPSEQWVSESNLTAFANQVGTPLWPYERFHRWSIAKPEEFWDGVWEFAEIIGEKGETVLHRAADKEMLGATWFPGSHLNFAENLLRGDVNHMAVIETGEDGIRRSLKMGQLKRMVAQAQTGLRDIGVEEGDRVAGITTNGVEGLVALLATASLGAIWTTCSPDFGPQGIVDRIGQVKPKVLIATLYYQYNGKAYDISENIRAVCESMEGLETLVTIEEDVNLANEDKTALQIISWKDLCQHNTSVPTFKQMSFEDPLYILYSSGTTGLPKAIVHSVGGTLIQHLKEHQLHCDIKPNDVMFWYTNTAWMMYHWLISGLASEATIVLYDGAAVLKEDPGILWRIAEETGVTHFGTSPKYLEYMKKEQYKVNQMHNFSLLKSVLSAGAPVSPEQYDWVYHNIKRDMMFASISGGAEILGCFVMGSPLHAVKRGEITCKSLGMAVDILDARGVTAFHEKGDLVCTEPFPSMPITFWGEGGDEKYKNTYFADRQGIWTHGDLAEQTIDQTVIIYGRTDTTLKPGGVRIGTAEIYRVLEQMSQVKDAIVFGLPNDGDEEIVLCVVTQEDHLTVEMANNLRNTIRTKASPRHVPRRIYHVSDIPQTLNGKKVEGAVRSTVLGKPVKNKGSIINPKSLEQYIDLTERQFL